MGEAERHIKDLKLAAATLRWVGEEVSPYTQQALGIHYPQADIEQLFDAAEAAMPAWADAGIETRIAEGVQAGLADFYRDNGITDGRPDLRPEAAVAKASSNPLHNRHAVGAVLDGKFESTGDLLKGLKVRVKLTR